MRTTLTSIALATSLGSLAQCPPGQIPDCNGNCQPETWVGDGICDNGWDYPSDFLCAAFNWDEGDCIGPGCTDSLATNYNPVATVDDGSCFYGLCPPGQITDCANMACYDSLEVMSYVGDWHCHNGLWLGGGWAIGNLLLDCDTFDFDGGDCIVAGCTDPSALNYYEHANTDDGSCQYGTCPPGTEDCMGHCIPEHWIGVNECPAGYTTDPLPHLHHGAYPDSLLFNIPVDQTPRGLCVLPDGAKAYVACGPFVTVIDLMGLDLGSWSSTSIYVGGLAYTCSPSVDGLHLFVANYGLQQVQVIDVASNAVVDQIPVGSSPLKMWTAHDGQRIFVSNHDGSSVTVIDASTWQVITTVTVGVNPRNICTSMNDSLLYTANWGSSSVSVVDLVTYQVIDTVQVDYWPQAIWPTPDGRYILVANFGFDHSFDHISVIRTSDHVVIARLQTGAGPEDMLTLGEEGQYLYVSNWGMSCCFNTAWDACCTAEVNKGTMTVIALPDFEAWVAPDSVPAEIPYIRSTLTTVPVQAEYAFGMARHPNGRYVFAVNKDSNTLSVVGLQDISTLIPEASEHDAFTWSLMPDPAHGECWVTSNDKILHVRLLDLAGREVRRWPGAIGRTYLSLQGVVAGNYLVEVRGQLGHEVRKLVVY